jgi:hypothetical protein
MPVEQITLGVYRDLTNRLIGEPDDGTLAREAHKKRRLALEEDLNEPCFKVVNWGDTKDSEPHEWVQVIVEVVTSPAAQQAAASAVIFLGGVLSETFSSLLVDGTKHIFWKLWGRMQKKEIEDFTITLPANSTIAITTDRQVNLNIAGGGNVSFSFDKPPPSAN